MYGFRQAFSNVEKKTFEDDRGLFDEIIRLAKERNSNLCFGECGTYFKRGMVK